MAEVATKSVRGNGDVLATGRRKTAVARVRLRPGNGTIKVNGRDLVAYFPAIKISCAFPTPLPSFTG